MVDKLKRHFAVVLTAAGLLGIACSSNRTAPMQAAMDSEGAIGAVGSLRLSMSNGDDVADEDVGLEKGKRTDSVEHIWITIKEVQLHVAGDSSDNGWKTVARPNKRFDFLMLVDGLTAPLDLYELPAGHYTQIRLLLGDEAEWDYWETPGPANAIVVNGETFPLTIPSGFKTGIKCVKSFFIAENEVTEICLAFDVRKAVHYSPGNGYMMRPAFRTFKCN